jgi:3-deoxy-D-manno-octulosonic acid kinase
MVPPGYERLQLAHATAVARSDVAPALRHLMLGAESARLSLHDHAARHPSARRMQGRGATYAIPLGDRGARVVVRHNHHGGFFAPLRRDLFLAPTRAPYELQTSLELARLGVPTPAILAYVLYPARGVLQRADVCSAEIADSHDLASVLTGTDAAERGAALAATAQLLTSLARAGARHADLNAKNILLSGDTAYVLDVDRVALGAQRDVAYERNLARLSRSLRKWRDQFGARISEQDITQLRAS